MCVGWTLVRILPSAEIVAAEIDIGTLTLGSSWPIVILRDAGTHHVNTSVFENAIKNRTWVYLLACAVSVRIISNLSSVTILSLNYSLSMFS